MLEMKLDEPSQNF